MRTMPRHGGKALRSGLAALAITTLVAACNSGTTSSTGGQSATDKEIASFTYATSQWPASLNGMTTRVATAQISSLVTQTLERFSYRNGAARFAPNLATSVRQPDAQTIVYTLREDVKFSDGTPLTADDVAWSVTAAAAPTAETAVGMQGFSSATVTGPGEVTVKWSYAMPGILLREVLAEIVEVQQAKFAKAHPRDLGTPSALPIGTGPFQYQSQTPQDIILVPNPNYWGPRPKVQKLVFTNITQDASAQLAVRSGAVQGTTLADPKTAPQWKGISGTSLHVARDAQFSFISLDMRTPPFDDEHVRKAIAYSIDRKGVAAAAFGGHADPLRGLLPTAAFSEAAPSLDAAKQFLDQLPSYDLDLAKAKAELAQSAHPQGFTARVTYSSGSPWIQQLLLNLQENMKPLGVTLDLVPQAPQEWFQKFFTRQGTGLQVFPGFGITNADPSTTLPTMIGKASMVPNLLNNANFTTPAVEAAYSALAPKTTGTFTKDQRWQATKTVLTEVANQVPFIPLYSVSTVHALADGYTYTQTPGVADLLSGAWIDYLRATR